MSVTVAVRRLQASDAGEYRAIRLSALKTAPDAFGATHAAEASKPMGDHAARLKSSVVLGAYEDGRIVGMIGLAKGTGLKEAHKGFMWGFYVEPGHRKRGIGAALIDALLQEARDAVEQVTLSVVEGTAATALYERFGFARYGVEPRALKSDAGYFDATLMVLFLPGTAPG